jgi:two-component system chemotaxis sensor kinase CheA
MAFDISNDELPIFLAETDDQIQLLEEELIRIEKNENDPEIIQSLFRAAHTLKGMAGMIGHKRLVELTHSLETAFDGVRKGNIEITTDFVDVCLTSLDALRILRNEVVENKELVDIDELLESTAKIAQLQTGKDEDSTQHKQGKDNAPKSEEPDSSSLRPGQEIEGQIIYTINAEINPDSIASAARAFQVYMALQGLGNIMEMSPTQEEIETAKPVEKFYAILESAHPEEEIKKTIEFISDITKVSISAQKPKVKSKSQTPLEGKVSQSTLDSLELSIKQRAVEKGSATQKVEKTVRTSVERLDSLMNLVGELITDRNRLNQLRSQLEGDILKDTRMGVLSKTITHIGHITDQLQEEVMRTRMVPIGQVFNKFPRMVRDISKKTGKDVNLVLSGEETEMDRGMVDEINDPLIHLLRNAIDHGIETPEERVAAGKPAKGTVWLSAKHEQGRIFITIEDDGSGIDANKIKASVVRRGMLTEAEAEALSREEAIDLIFLSGVSTNKNVTDISGRGVGMDIVKNNIEKINGSIQVETEPGSGTKFQIILPLTLAIVPTLLVQSNSSVFAIPLVTVLATHRLSDEKIDTINGQKVMRLRDSVLPLADLKNIFNLPPSKNSIATPNDYVVVVTIGKIQFGIVVDKLIGEEEVVVKSMGALIGDVAGISSAAILGDGQVALIVDVQSTFKLAGNAKKMKA